MSNRAVPGSNQSRDPHEVRCVGGDGNEFGGDCRDAMGNRAIADAIGYFAQHGHMHRLPGLLIHAFTRWTGFPVCRYFVG